MTNNRQTQTCDRLGYPVPSEEEEALVKGTAQEILDLITRKGLTTKQARRSLHLVSETITSLITAAPIPVPKETQQ